MKTGINNNAGPRLTLLPGHHADREREVGTYRAPLQPPQCRMPSAVPAVQRPPVRIQRQADTYALHRLTRDPVQEAGMHSVSVHPLTPKPGTLHQRADLAWGKLGLPPGEPLVERDQRMLYQGIDVVLLGNVHQHQTPRLEDPVILA